MEANERIGKVAISPEGETALRKLAMHLNNNNESIKDFCNTLQRTAGEQESSIGIYGEPLKSMVGEIKSAQAKGEESIIHLKDKIEQLADRIAEFCAQGLN